jgi:hypothetical protein
MTDLDDATVESLVTAHLRARAAQADPRPDLGTVLARAFEPPHRSGSRARWLAVAAAVLVLAAVAGVGLAEARRDPSVEIRPATTSTATTAAPSTTVGVLPGSDHDLDLPVRGPVPGSGVLVVTDGGVVRMLGPDGTLVATGLSPAGRQWPSGEVTARPRGDRVVLHPGRPDEYPARGLPAGQECAVLDRTAALTVKTCRTGADTNFGRDLVVAGPAGGERRIVGAVYPGDVYPGTTQEVAGHWVGARISPDGAWLLAQWSGECEVPAAYLVRIADGAVLGADGRPLPPPGDAAPGDSWALTWAGDRALIAVTGGPCGGTGDGSAVWSVDPRTGARTKVVPLHDDGDGFLAESVCAWVREDA